MEPTSSTQATHNRSSSWCRERNAGSPTRRPSRVPHMKIEGIHHVTCITGDAPNNVDFYVRVLGLRMVKKTVNQDDPTVYHLFYADEQGSPGADITFFEYPGVRRGTSGPSASAARGLRSSGTATGSGSPTRRVSGSSSGPRTPGILRSSRG